VNYKYYYDVLKAHGFDKTSYTEEEQEKIQSILDFYEEKMPKSNAH
jgi:hypothetical protein